MPIKIDVEAREEAKARKLGACLLEDGKTWVIPDELDHINKFKPWLPCEEGFLVKRPYFVVRARMPCYKCKKETTVVALGAKVAQEAAFRRGDTLTWKKWDVPILFDDVEYVDDEVVESLQDYYPFFKYKRVRALGQKIWGNACMHCGAMQEEDDEFRYEANALRPGTIKAAREVRLIYFKLNFDYYIQACWSYDPFFNEFVLGESMDK
ncbi:MAG: hypothetical protein BGO55_09205 [Sphingobacteriales bacterium 50-39]|nr:hypothetical protein [Sphingobacteriales bacterium]OJW57723.1 MAG: hypothetical protein BGO55_09205 [Sphingobacteriales bacterium 50-39]